MCSRKSSQIRDIFHTGDSSDTTFLIFQVSAFSHLPHPLWRSWTHFFSFSAFHLLLFSNAFFECGLFLADVALKLDCFTNLDFFAVCFFLGQELSWSGFNPSPPHGPLLYQHDGFLSHMSSLRARVTSLKSCAAAVLRPPYHSYTVNNDSSIYVPTASSTLLFLSSVVGSLRGSGRSPRSL